MTKTPAVAAAGAKGITMSSSHDPTVPSTAEQPPPITYLERLAQLAAAGDEQGVRELLAGLRRQAPVQRLETHAADAVLRQPLRAPRWLLGNLHLGPGRPAMVCGFGFSGKTIFVLTVVLAVAGGVPLFGRWPTVPGRCLLLDYEVGLGGTSLRLRRLARSMGLDLDKLADEDRVHVAALPTTFLDDPHAEKILLATCKGFDLIVVDSFRQAYPHTDENASDASRHLGMLTRVATTLNAAIILVHHSGKPKDGDRDVRTLPRGSSALFAQGGSVFVMSRKDEGIVVTQAKTPSEAWGREVAPFTIRIDDDPDVFVDVLDADGSVTSVPGLLVSLVEAPEAVPSQDPTRELLAVVHDEPGITQTALAQRLGGRKQRVLDRVQRLASEGLLTLSRSEGVRLTPQGEQSLADVPSP